MSAVSPYTTSCRRCGHEFEIGDGWSRLCSVVECESCFTLNEIHVDEDADCNFWFVTDEPHPMTMKRTAP